MAFSVVMPALEMAQETGKLLAGGRKKETASPKASPSSKLKPIKPSSKWKPPPTAFSPE